MNPQEIRDKLMAAINGIIKDEPDTAEANLHDILAAKMRARINGDEVEPEPTEVTPDPLDPDPSVTPTPESVEQIEEPPGA